MLLSSAHCLAEIQVSVRSQNARCPCADTVSFQRFLLMLMCCCSLWSGRKVMSVKSAQVLSSGISSSCGRRSQSVADRWTIISSSFFDTDDDNVIFFSGEFRNEHHQASFKVLHVIACDAVVCFFLVYLMICIILILFIEHRYRQSRKFVQFSSVY